MEQALRRRLSRLTELLDALEDSNKPLSDVFKSVQRFAIDIKDPALELWMHLELNYRLHDPFVRRFPGDVRMRVGELSIEARSYGNYWTDLLGPYLAAPDALERAKRPGGSLAEARPIHEIEATLAAPSSGDPIAEMYRHALQNVYNRLRNSVHEYLLEVYRDSLESLSKLPPKTPLGFIKE